MNETEFQNKAYEILNNLMPTFSKADITCQGSFSFKFGHHNITIGGKEPSKTGNRAIYDFLVYVKNEPLILIELKRPGSQISDQDIRQAISYARLTERLTPITIISNGEDHLIYDTLSFKPFEISHIDSDFLEKIKNNLTIAGSELQSSLEVLINSDQTVMLSIINNITDNSFNAMKGNENEFEKTLLNNFNVPREALPNFIEKVNDKQFILLNGDAFVGKTTFLSQFHDTEKIFGNATLYIDSQEIFYNIFKKISIYLSGKLGHYIDESKVREWFMMSVSKHSTLKINIIFDSLKFGCDPEILKHIVELKDIFKISNQRIIICSDTSNYKIFTEHKGRRSQTIIGRDFEQFELTQFTTTEYQTANKLMTIKYNFRILEGGEFSREYRVPRIWRLLINEFLAEKTSEKDIIATDSVPNILFLDLFKSNFSFDPQTVTDFKKFTSIFVEYIANIKKKTKLLLLVYNLGITPEEFVQQHLDKHVIERLVNAGFIERRYFEEEGWFFIPKLPELIAGYAIDIIEKKFILLFEKSFDKTYKDFLKTCEYFPYGELVAAKVLYNMGHGRSKELFSKIINKLIYDEPEHEVSDSEKVLAIYSEETGIIRFKSEEGTYDKMYSNTFPYLVLAHLTYMNFGDYSEDPHKIRFRVIGKIGNSKFLQRRPDYNFFHNGISNIGSENSGDFMHTNLGILEPIVSSMKINFIYYPVQFEKMYEEAKKGNSYHLLHRIYITAKNTSDFGTSKVKLVCDRIIMEYEREIMYKIFAFIDSDPNTSRAAFRQLYKDYKKRGKKISNKN